MSATSWEVLGSNPSGVEFSGSAGGVSDLAYFLTVGYLSLSEQTQSTAR